MSTPLLESKLFLPQPRRGLVPRPRLRERLHQGLAAKLMLVSAPAGFGKTTLLVDGIASAATRTDAGAAAWVSLDAGDNDPTTFWTYVVSSLRTAIPGVGDTALDLLGEPHPPPSQTVLTTLINDLGAVAVDVVLVLDDYHVIDSPEVQEGMVFLLDHLPSRLHLVIAGRADPPLPLPRLRARGDLVEIRAADLRFTADEAAAYLNETMGLGLAPEDVETLDIRTEGWIAALQLAALSMAGRDDVSGFIAGFAGDDRYVVDYLVEEVLHRQPPSVQAFLLHTSVLDRMNGSLCDALTGQDGGRAVLERLDRDNLFLVPLDDRRQWYRYHHLFADVLRARLLDEQPGQAARLHRLASAWYEQHGDRAEAIRHAMAAGDFAAAADLVELALPALRRDRREATFRAWLELLPDDVLGVRPILCNALAGARMSTGTFEGVEELLRAAERWLAQAPGGAATPTGMVVVDHDELHRLPAEIAMHRAGLALVRGDTEGTIEFARTVLDVADEDDDLARGAASALMGLAAWSDGDLEVAHASYVATLAHFERIGHISDVLGCSITLGDIQVTQGRLRTAMRTYEQALDLASRHASHTLRGTADMHVGRADIHRELDDVGAARRDLARCRELGEHAGLPQNAYRWRVVMAQVREAEGDLDAAVDLLDEAVRLYEGDFSPNVRPVPAVRARARIRQGRLDEARAWLGERQLTADDTLTYLREFEHVTLARLLLAQHVHDGPGAHLDQAIGLLARLLRSAEEAGRGGSVLEIRVLESLAFRMAGDPARALSSLEAAVHLAEPEGHVRVFIDEGEPMAALLAALADTGAASPHVRRLRSALGAASPRTAPGPPPRGTGLVEPLSSRELDVLRLLGTDLSGPEIARELVVSLNTVRTHTRNLYLKLGVNSRRAALSRARELGLR